MYLEHVVGENGVTAESEVAPCLPCLHMLPYMLSDTKVYEP